MLSSLKDPSQGSATEESMTNAVYLTLIQILIIHISYYAQMVFDRTPIVRRIKNLSKSHFIFPYDGNKFNMSFFVLML